MSESYRDDLRSLDLFRNMQRANFDSLMRAAYVQNFPPRIDLIHEGDTPDFLHVVLTGSVDLFSTWNGRETSMATVRPVSTFILLPSEDVRAIFDIDHDFARAIVTELAQCYRAVVKNTKDLKLRSSLERLANYLLRERGREGADAFTLRMEKRRLASSLGMTPENLSRAFKALEAYGVQVTGTQITLMDPEDLSGFAKPSPLIDGRNT